MELREFPALTQAPGTRAPTEELPSDGLEGLSPIHGLPEQTVDGATHLLSPSHGLRLGTWPRNGRTHRVSQPPAPCKGSWAC